MAKIKLDIVTICGSARKDSFNAALLRAIPGISAGDFVFKAGPSVADVPIYDGDVERSSGVPPLIATLAAAIRDADGVLIVSPEYNYSIPGGLKNVLDWVSRVPNQPFAGKPLLIQSVSAGAMGGVRMQYHLRQVMVFLNARVLARPEIFIGSAQIKFSSEGDLTDAPTREAVRLQLVEFAAFIRERQSVI